MISLTLTGTGRGVNGSAFMIEGMSSALDPSFVDDRAYRHAQNVVNHGGLLQTRPGYRQTLRIPDGRLQGFTWFQPSLAAPYLVFAVSGRVYTSQYPFSSFTVLPGLQFHPDARQVYWSVATQSAQTLPPGTVYSAPARLVVGGVSGQFVAPPANAAGSPYTITQQPVSQTVNAGTTAEFAIQALGTTNTYQWYFNGQPIAGATQQVLQISNVATANAGTYVCIVSNSGGVVQTIDPKKVLIMQDGGYSPSAYWDGRSAEHLFGADDATPLGGPMAWSGDRLWVAQGNKVFAGDIENPLSFLELTFDAGGGFFLFPEEVTGLAEIPSFQSPNLAVFTANGSYLLQSSIRDRSTWQSTPLFQQPLFPGVGCVSQRSINTQFGLLWWMTPTGLTNFNAAQQSKITAQLSEQDSEMSVSKGNLAPDMSGIACGSYGNYLTVSVPSGDKYNSHTWVLDQAVTSQVEEGSTYGWNSIWTGTRPVEWAYGKFGNTQRLFHASVDADGANRIWETFIPDREDNGDPVECFVETKTHLDFGEKSGTALDLKQFKFAEIVLTEILGTVTGSIYWAGTRGTYKKISDFKVVATEGPVSFPGTADMTTIFGTNVSQSRTIRTPEIPTSGKDTESQSVNGVEVRSRNDYLDRGFSLLIVWQGRAALESYRIFADVAQESGAGRKIVQETGPNVVQAVPIA